MPACTWQLDFIIRNKFLTLEAERRRENGGTARGLKQVSRQACAVQRAFVSMRSLRSTGNTRVRAAGQAWEGMWGRVSACVCERDRDRDKMVAIYLGISICFSKIHIIPLHLYKRLTLVPVFRNQKYPREFSLLEKKGKSENNIPRLFCSEPLWRPQGGVACVARPCCMVFAHCLVQLGTRERRGWGALEVNIPGTCWIPALPCHCSHFIDKDAHTGMSLARVPHVRC